MSEKPEYLYRIQPTRPAMLVEGPTQIEAEIVAQHFSYLEDLLTQGVLVLAGRTLNTDPTSFGIVVFRAANDADARLIMQADPVVQQGVMAAELFPYRIALLASGG